MNVSVFLKCLFEFLGTFVMILLGVGVCACTSLAKSKGQGAGWIVVTLAWGLAVMCGVLIAGPYTGAHLNPAVTIGLASAGKFSWALVAPYIISQIIGALLGAMCVYWFYKDHFDLTDDPEPK
ncbi:MAG: aquaporin family protein, partial [Muribaculaceae bacterium]|nr:aquaporin family protein [Muribaculaceae bacterium]